MLVGNPGTMVFPAQGTSGGNAGSAAAVPLDLVFTGATITAARAASAAFFAANPARLVDGCFVYLDTTTEGKLLEKYDLTTTAWVVTSGNLVFTLS